MIYPKSCPGTLYIIKRSQKCWVKIGRTINVNRRLEELRKAYPDDILTLIWSFQSEYIKDLESLLHLWFTDDRTEGEWFLALPEEVIDMVKVMAPLFEKRLYLERQRLDMEDLIRRSISDPSSLTYDEKETLGEI